MSEALIVQGGGRVPTAEEDVAGVRTVLRIQLSDEQRIRIGISGDRDLALCVNRLCDALTEAEDERNKVIAAFDRVAAAVGPVSGWLAESPADIVANRVKELRAEVERLTRERDESRAAHRRDAAWAERYKIKHAEARRLLERAQTTLRALMDVQNGPPLLAWEQAWSDAMAASISVELEIRAHLAGGER